MFRLRPIGTIELTNESETGTVLEGTVAESDSELDDDVDTTFNNMQQRMRYTASPNGKSEAGGLRVRCPKAEKSERPGEDDLLDSIWGGVPVDFVNKRKHDGEDQDGGSKQARKGNTGKGAATGSGINNRGRSAKTGLLLGGGGATTTGKDTKLAKELETSERASLGITQFPKKFEDNAQIRHTTQKACSGQVKSWSFV